MDTREKVREYVRRLEDENRQLRRALGEKVGADPAALMPAIDAYVEEAISGARLRECIVEWLAGTDFRTDAERPWEHYHCANVVEAAERVKDEHDHTLRKLGEGE